MRKIIFLDIDGVLNSHDWWKRREKLPPSASRDEFMNEQLDPLAIQLFQALLADVDAEVVLSSVWRLHKEDRDMIKKRVVDFIDVTPDSDCRIRGCEIRSWTEKNVTYDERKELKYAIIDDDSDMLLWQKDSFFQTSFKTGLTPEICDKIRVHFGVEKMYS
jgi:hypothetical protein